MKKFTSVIRLSIAAVVAFVAISFTSCGIAADTIEKSVEKANMACPLYVDEYTTCQRIYTSGNNIIYDYRTYPELIEIFPTVDYNECKNIHISDLANAKIGNKELKLLLDLCVEAEYNIIYDYNDGMGNSFKVTITYDDIKKL